MKIEIVYSNDCEEMGLYARGEFDKAEFCAAAAEAWRAYCNAELEELPVPEEVRYEWWREEPNDESGDLAVLFRPAKPGEPGAYPVTCWSLYGDETLAHPKTETETPTAESAPPREYGGEGHARAALEWIELNVPNGVALVALAFSESWKGRT